MLSADQQKLMKWVSRCDAIAGSASYILNGYPEEQVGVMRLQLRKAAADGIDWRKIYESIYERWHGYRPLFPTPDVLAAQIEESE